MTELERLLGSSQNKRTRALLRAAQSEASPRHFSERLLAGLGPVTAASAAAAALGSGVKHVGFAAGGAASGGGATGAGALMLAKWVVVGALGGGFLAAGADVAFSRGQPARSASAHVPVIGAPAPARAALPLSAAPAPASAPEPSSATPVDAATVALHVAAATPPPAASGQLGREVQIIDRARRASAAGDNALALSELDAYAKVARTGVLDREARVLRIQTLRKLGNNGAAQQLTQQYLQEFPDDAHAQRLRATELNGSP